MWWRFREAASAITGMFGILPQDIILPALTLILSILIDVFPEQECAYLGVITWTILDEFSEYFQKACDPPPPRPRFGKLYCAFLQQTFRIGATPPFSRKFIAFPPQNNWKKGVHPFYPLSSILSKFVEFHPLFLDTFLSENVFALISLSKNLKQLAQLCVSL